MKTLITRAIYILIATSSQIRLEIILVHEIILEKLVYGKFCVRWVPKIIMEDEKKRMAAVIMFLKD